MISALKMIAETIALLGVPRCMMLSAFSGPRAPAFVAYVNAKLAGRIAKYFATSFAIENVVRAPRVMRSCLPTSTISISFVGFESRSTILPASFAAEVPVFMATPTSACASAGASFVRSEEHTSELQSQFHLVCRLLLEKKKDDNRHQTPRH